MQKKYTVVKQPSAERQKKYIHEDIFSLPTQNIKKYRNYDRSIWMENIIDYDDDKHL